MFSKNHGHFFFTHFTQTLDFLWSLIKSSQNKLHKDQKQKKEEKPRITKTKKRKTTTWKIIKHRKKNSQEPLKEVVILYSIYT